MARDDDLARVRRDRIQRLIDTRFEGSKPVGPDYDWAWDEFFDESFRLVWACRGVQTGQFADQSRCASKLKADLTWPEKTAPSRP